MKTLSNYFGKTLNFVQPSIWKRNFELLDGNEVIGTLTYPKFFSVKAEAKIFDNSWEFYEPKWWKNLIEIREPGRELPIASFKPALLKNKETLKLPSGESMILNSNLFSTTIEILDHYSSRLVSLKRKMNVKTTYEIQIEKRSEVLDRNPWVLLLIIYAEINKNRRRSAG
ncbi:MAG: hypothetical protein HXY50_02965 [Ignavibacteriaceae bacterium]|nr:hypothetical protein [Ignavibacteriaceae bacterium]